MTASWLEYFVGGVHIHCCGGLSRGVHRNSTARRANARPRCLVVHAFPCRSCRRLRSFDLAFAIWRLLKIKIKKIAASGSPYRYFVICVPRNSVKNLICCRCPAMPRLRSRAQFRYRQPLRM